MEYDTNPVAAMASYSRLMHTHTKKQMDAAMLASRRRNGDDAVDPSAHLTKEGSLDSTSTSGSKPTCHGTELASCRVGRVLWTCCHGLHIKSNDLERRRSGRPWADGAHESIHIMVMKEHACKQQGQKPGGSCIEYFH